MQAIAGLRPRLPWQPAAAAWAAERTTPYFALDKRLGKCTLAIEWALQRQCQYILVVTQPSAMADWMVELEADGQKGVLLTGSRDERIEEMNFALRMQSGDQPIFFVVNPQGLFLPAGRKIDCGYCGGRGVLPDGHTCGECEGKGKVRADQPEATDIARIPWECVIWDEPTVGLANPRTQINTIAFQWLARCPFKACLSGEPAPEGPQQLFEQMRWLHGHFMGHRKYYAWLDENFKQVNYDWYPLPSKLQAIKDAFRAKAYVISRKEAGLKNHRTFERYGVVLPSKLRTAYDTCESYMEVPSSDGGSVPLAMTKYKVVSSNWLSQLAGGYPKDFAYLESPHKTDAVVDMVTGRFREESLVIVCRFNREVAAVFKALADKGVSAGLIWGSTPVPRRKQLQAQFNLGTIRVLVMQIKCARHGLNLSRASTMIRFSLSDGWEDISQSMDRIVSPTKSDVLAYVDIVALDTVDEDRLDALADKKINSRFFMEIFRKKFEQRKQRKAVAV